MHGELLVLGVKVAASTVWESLQEAGIDPAPERGSATWAGFIAKHAGVANATLYRHSPARESLVLEAYRDRKSVV